MSAVTIFIARHGKAHQGSPTGRDRDRELMSRGERQAAYLGEHLGRMPAAPTQIISSPVVRAKRTAEIINEALRLPIRFDDRLASGAPAGQVLEAALEACHADPVHVRPLIVGHNPTLEYLLALLTLGAESGLDDMRHVRTGEAFAIRISDPASPLGACEVVWEGRLTGADD